MSVQTVQNVELVEPTEDEQNMVWIVSEGNLHLVDKRPLPAHRFDSGHFWMFDHGTSDLDQPYSCGLCGEAKWKSYDKPCADGRTPDDLNRERAQWIADRALTEEPVFEVRNGFRQAQQPKLRRTINCRGAAQVTA